MLDGSTSRRMSVPLSVTGAMLGSERFVTVTSPTAVASPRAAKVMSIGKFTPPQRGLGEEHCRNGGNHDVQSFHNRIELVNGIF